MVPVELDYDLCKGDAAVMFCCARCYVMYPLYAVVIKEGFGSENEAKGEFSPALFPVMIYCLLKVFHVSYIFYFLLAPGYGVYNSVFIVTS